MKIETDSIQGVMGSSDCVFDICMSCLVASSVWGSVMVDDEN